MSRNSVNTNAKYSLDESGCFVIENYNETKPFSNFFPGIAGLWGIPMWAFYVNRGQGIASFGVHSKDKAILEFQPANKAYRVTSLNGFRTFLKLKSGGKTIVYEPFQLPSLISHKIKQTMKMTSHDLTLEEVNATLGLKITVNYFTLAQEPLAALVRRVTVTNLSKQKKDIRMIDGLPAVTPYGLNDWVAKHMCRTVEAWIKVRRIKEKTPYFHLNVEVNDTPQVKHIREGNFYFSFEEGGAKLSDVIVEAACVFGNSLDFRVPEVFVDSAKFSVPPVQQTSNRTPCAMSFTSFKLGAKQAKPFVSMAGFAYNQDQVQKFAAKALEQGFTDKKAQENKDVVGSVKDFAFTKSSSKEFDMYCGQTFLDNVMRGGLPVSLQTEEGKVALNVYSRKHGDLERDYNFFTLAPTYFSQGNGNYRDVNQNRRNDVWFNTDVKESGIVSFLSLIQADGYNPLVVKGLTFVAHDEAKLQKFLDTEVPPNSRSQVEDFLKKGFQPGDLLNFISTEDIKLKSSLKDFLGKVLNVCHKHESADHGEGFWADHWTYNIDLLESFTAVYPEKLRALLWEEKPFHFYHNSHYTLPRNERYILTKSGVRQYHSVLHDAKGTKADQHGNKLRIRNGDGDVYHTHLMGKLLCLAANKVSSLDPSGIGIEMEADKPNWYDALNGLPGLLGSSINETFELKRLALFLQKTLDEIQAKADTKVLVFNELHIFITRLIHTLATEKDALNYWQKSNDLKEHYRYRVRQGIDGEEQPLTVSEIRKFLQLVVERMDRGVAAAKTRSGHIPTYLYHEVVEHERLEKTHTDGPAHIKPLKFRRHDLPLFLEGFVHALRAAAGTAEARKIYEAVRKSPLFDTKLKMYKVNTDLSGETEEIGRTRIFPAGWLENESIWLHMEYKFLLELLRNGLYEEYFENFQATLVPFLKPKTYGRSILENCSFIVSSAHEDKALHGQGFVARLSGSTAELLHLWLWMNVGQRPFSLDAGGKLCATLQPVLPGWLFTKKSSGNIPKDCYAFRFLGNTLVVYHNPKREDTFGKNACRVQKIFLSYSEKSAPVTLSSSVISAPHSYDLRDHKIQRIDVELG